MSLNDWSIVIFGVTFLSYMTIYFAMFTKPHAVTFIITFITWAAAMITKLLYGLATDQIGFVLLFFLDIFMIFLVFVITGRYINDAQNT